MSDDNTTLIEGSGTALTSRASFALRLAQQRLTRNQLATPPEVVAWLGAMQAQDYQGAKWGIGLRKRQPSDSAVERPSTMEGYFEPT